MLLNIQVPQGRSFVVIFEDVNWHCQKVVVVSRLVIVLVF